MKRLVFLIIILIVPYPLPAGALDVNAQYDMETGLAQGTGISRSTTDDSALAKDASEILARMTDFISAAPAMDMARSILWLEKQVVSLHFLKNPQRGTSIEWPSQLIRSVDNLMPQSYRYADFSRHCCRDTAARNRCQFPVACVCRHERT